MLPRKPSRRRRATPDIKVSGSTGQFFTLNVSHQAADPNEVSFSEAITFQLFQDLTPKMYSILTLIITNDFYNGKNFHRVANGSPLNDVNGFIVQGGSL